MACYDHLPPRDLSATTFQGDRWNGYLVIEDVATMQLTWAPLPAVNCTHFDSAPAHHCDVYHWSGGLRPSVACCACGGGSAIAPPPPQPPPWPCFPGGVYVYSDGNPYGKDKWHIPVSRFGAVLSSDEGIGTDILGLIRGITRAACLAKLRDDCVTATHLRRPFSSLSCTTSNTRPPSDRTVPARGALKGHRLVANARGTRGTSDDGPPDVARRVFEVGPPRTDTALAGSGRTCSGGGTLAASPRPHRSATTQRPRR